VEERLNAIGVSDPAAGGDQQTLRDGAPKTDSLATLLTQGLLSDDRVMINVRLLILFNIWQNLLHNELINVS